VWKREEEDMTVAMEH